ncbi:MAG TPA: translocated intimin receptor Tir [Verrucomicrobiae bacterium]|nr:translocated intimin receptor Tir [Verrucomicrobiae bacterium]
MKDSMLKAILTDAHFWVPVAVLVIGIAVLLAVK